MKDTDQLIVDIIQWGQEKGIYDKATPLDQMRKMQEEVGELWEAIAIYDESKIIEELGDVLVTAILQAEMNGLTIQGCLAHALAKISARKGRMINGQFVKDETSH